MSRPDTNPDDRWFNADATIHFNLYSVRGQACVLENGFWRLYLPMTWRETELTGNRAHGVQYRGSFEGLTANRMRAVNVNFTQRAVFTRE